MGWNQPCEKMREVSKRIIHMTVQNGRDGQAGLEMIKGKAVLTQKVDRFRKVELLLKA